MAPPKSRKKASGGGKRGVARKGQGKKPAAKAAPAREIEGDSVHMVIGKKDLQYLTGYANECLNKAGNVTSSLGQEISTYVKTKGLNAQAFRIGLRFYRVGMRNPIKLRALLDDIEHYLDVMGVNKLAAADMFKGGERKGGVGGKKKGRQIDLSERKDTNGAGGENITDLDQHRDRAQGEGGEGQAADNAA